MMPLIILHGCLAAVFFFVMLRQLDFVLIWRQLCGWLKTKYGVVLKKFPVSGKDQSADLIMMLEATL